MTFNAFHWSNEYNMVRTVAGCLDVDPITALTAQVSSLAHKLAIANSVSLGTSITGESSVAIGSYMATNQTKEEVQYGNDWGYRNYHESNLPTHHRPGLRNHENFSNENLGNTMNPYSDYQPQPTEKKSSLEDLMSAFVTESRARFSWNEERLDNIEVQMGNINASIKSLETQIGQLANSIYISNKGVYLSNTEFFENLEDCATNDESVQYPLEYCNENSISQDIVDAGEVIEHVLALEELSKEKISNKVKPLDEESLIEEVRVNLEPKQLPKSLRYANFDTDSFFPMISSSSFTGVEEEKLWQVQDHGVKFNIFKEMRMQDENNNCFKIDMMDDIIEEFSEKPIDNTEAIEYVYQLGAQEKFQMPRPRFKEPEHRKAKFHFKEGRP